MWAPVVPAVRTTSSAPSINVSGASSTMSRECVNVGTPAVAAKRGDSQVLGRIDAGCVADEHADTDGAGGQVGLDLVEDPRHLRRRSRPVATPVPTSPPKTAAMLPLSGPSAITCMRADAHEAEKP